MMTEEKIAKEAKRNLRQGVPDLVDMHEAIGMAESDDERYELTAIAAKMQALISEGYESEAVPDLGKPTRLGSGDLRFLARSDAMRQGAEAVLASGAVEDWIFNGGEEDEKVTGRVTSVEPVHALAYFTVRPSEDGSQ